MDKLTKEQRLEVFKKSHPLFSSETYHHDNYVRKHRIIKDRWKNENVRKWINDNPEKAKAHKLVYGAMRNGTLKRKPCEVCGIEKSEAHHEDYSKPLEVIWLCKRHHVDADKNRRNLTK